MRVTNNMRQDQVATGKRFERASEDPVAATRVTRSDRMLRGIAQYRRNATAVRARIDAEEAVLGQLTDLVTRARELGIAESTATSTAATRAAAAAELDRLLEQAVQLGNSRVGSEYLYGGHQTATRRSSPTAATSVTTAPGARRSRPTT